MDPITPAPLHPSAYADGFARAHLPPREQWPELVFDVTTAAYPERLNAAAALLDAAVARGQGDRVALIHAAGLPARNSRTRLSVSGCGCHSPAPTKHCPGWMWM